MSNTVDKTSAFYEKYVEPFIDENDLDGYNYTVEGDEMHWKVDLSDISEGYYIDYYLNLKTGNGDIIFREPFGDGYNSTICDAGGALYLRGY